MESITAEQLRIGQETIENAIWHLAEEKKLTTDKIAPITDGIADFEAYLASSPRVAWILKEPYDEVRDGTIAGGGWSIPRDCFMKSGGSWPDPLRFRQ